MSAVVSILDRLERICQSRPDRSIAYCYGCGSRSRGVVCDDCRYSDRQHRTCVIAPGRPCGECGAEVVR
jgi:hypothetical protein